jgi:hypothetical protein
MIHSFCDRFARLLEQLNNQEILPIDFCERISVENEEKKKTINSGHKKQKKKHKKKTSGQKSEEFDQEKEKDEEMVADLFNNPEKSVEEEVINELVERVLSQSQDELASEEENDGEADEEDEHTDRSPLSLSFPHLVVAIPSSLSRLSSSVIEDESNNDKNNSRNESDDAVQVNWESLTSRSRSLFSEESRSAVLRLVHYQKNDRLDLLVSTAIEFLAKSLFNNYNVTDSETGEEARERDREELNLIQTIFVAAITGWAPFSCAAAPVVHTNNSNNINNNSRENSNSSSSSSSASSVLGCELCQQKMDLKEFLNRRFEEDSQGTKHFPSTKKMDFLKEHRYFCPWTNPQLLNGEKEVEEEKQHQQQEKNQSRTTDSFPEKPVCGWELCLQTVKDCLKSSEAVTLRKRGRGRPTTAGNNNNNNRKRARDERESDSFPVLSAEQQQSSSSSSPQPSRSSATAVHDLSPENVFKKIRSVLSSVMN